MSSTTENIEKNNLFQPISNIEKDQNHSNTLHKTNVLKPIPTPVDEYSQLNNSTSKQINSQVNESLPRVLHDVSSEPLPDVSSEPLPDVLSEPLPDLSSEPLSKPLPEPLHVVLTETVIESINKPINQTNKNNELESVDLNSTQANSVVKTFSETLQLILSLSDMTNYSVKLTPELVKILLDVVKSNPDYFNDLEVKIINILNNKKVDVKSVSNIITLLKDLYKILYNLNIQDVKKGLNISSCETILKFVVNVVLVDKIHNEDEKTELLKSIDEIISIGVELITVRKVLQTNRSGLFSCFFSK